MSSIKYIAQCVCLLLFYVVFSCGAGDVQPIGTPMNFHGVVMSRPCGTINNNQPILVEFGNVMTTKVFGDNYRVKIDYTLNCNSVPGAQLQMQIKGGESDFNGYFLKTSANNLGVKIDEGGVLRPINTWFPISITSAPDLWATLQKPVGASLSAGEFNAIASMLFSYQ